MTSNQRKNEARKGGKFDPKLIGSYEITDIDEFKHLVSVKDLKSNKVLNRKIPYRELVPLQTSSVWHRQYSDNSENEDNVNSNSDNEVLFAGESKKSETVTIIKNKNDANLQALFKLAQNPNSWSENKDLNYMVKNLGPGVYPPGEIGEMQDIQLFTEHFYKGIKKVDKKFFQIVHINNNHWITIRFTLLPFLFQRSNSISFLSLKGRGYILFKIWRG